MDIRKILPVALIVIMLIGTLVIVIISLPPPTNGDTTDTTPPVVTITGPSADATVYGAEAITFTAVDNSSIDRYEIHVDGVFTAVGQSYNWNTRSIADGTHEILCRARDANSNWGETNISVTVDNSITFASEDFDPIFKVMAYNIEESGLNPDWKEVVKEENPDILMLVETGYMDNDGSETLNAAVAELNAYFVDEDPYEGFCAQGISFSTSGEAVLSRFPVVIFRQIQIVYLDDESGYDVTHDFVDAIIDINGTEVHFVGCHLKAGGSSTDADRREWENEGIINYFDSLGDVPIVYLGDINSYSPVDTGDLAPNDPGAGDGPMTMLVDTDHPVYGQYSSEVHNFTDVFRELNPTDPGFTFGHQYTPLLGRIDYIIANQFFEDKLVNSTTGDTAHALTGADHYSVDVFINWTGGLTLNASIPEPSAVELVVINEFLPWPDSAYLEEFIELFNPSAEAVSVGGYFLDDLIGGGTTPYEIPPDTFIPAGGYLVFWDSETEIGLSNGGDDVNLIKPDGVTVQDNYTYASSTSDVSYGRVTDGNSTWTTFVTPTPGMSNNGSGFVVMNYCIFVKDSI